MSTQVLDVAVAQADVLLLDVLGPLFDALHQNQPPSLRAWSAGGHGTRSLLHNAIDICQICNDVGRLGYPKSAVELADILATDLFEAASEALSEAEYAQFVAACSTAPRKTAAKKAKKAGPTSTAMETAQLFFAPGKKRNNPARKKPAPAHMHGRYNGHTAAAHGVPAEELVELLIHDVFVPAASAHSPYFQGPTLIQISKERNHKALHGLMRDFTSPMYRFPQYVRNLADIIANIIEEDILHGEH